MTDIFQLLGEHFNPENKKAEFTTFDNSDQWVSGKYGDYTFQAKLFDEGSSFGINDGRVSKLTIKCWAKTVVNYDRGWDMEPIMMDKPAYNAIMELLENSPKRFKEESKDPLYKVLNEKRTQGEAICNTYNSAFDPHVEVSIPSKKIRILTTPTADNDAQTNAQYAVLALNNLAAIAELLEWIVKEIETTPNELSDALLGLIKIKAKQALSKIS